MNYLFDTSPTEVPDKPKKGRRAKQAPEAAEQPAPEVRYVEHAIIGQSDGHYTCHKPSCQATYFDIIDDYRGEWVIECAFCGWQQRVPAIEGVIAAKSDFVFHDGRFSGMTLADVAKTEKGEAYIRWCAEKHKSGSVKEACLKWLAAIGYAAPHRSEPCSS